MIRPSATKTKRHSQCRAKAASFRLILAFRYGSLCSESDCSEAWSTTFVEIFPTQQLLTNKHVCRLLLFVLLHSEHV